MNSESLAILLGSALLSFILGSLLRAWVKKRRRKKTQELLLQVQALAREQRLNEKPSLNKAKRRRQERERAHTKR